MTEFGRRVEMNDSGGTDHGHGSLIWLLGGGLAGSGVYGKLDRALRRDARRGRRARRSTARSTCSASSCSKRLGTSLTGVFPGHSYSPIGRRDDRVTLSRQPSSCLNCSLIQAVASAMAGLTDSRP